jgi:hypothetical protein
MNGDWETPTFAPARVGGSRELGLQLLHARFKLCSCFVIRLLCFLQSQDALVE